MMLVVYSNGDLKDRGAAIIARAVDDQLLLVHSTFELAQTYRVYHKRDNVSL